MNQQFLQALAELRKTRQRTFDWDKWKGVEPGASGWNAMPWQGNTPQVIVYDPKTGKAYPNPQAATSAGVINFAYNLPSGMTVDWSYWDQFTQPMAPSTTASPMIADQTLPFNPAPYSPNQYPAATPPVNSSLAQDEPEEEPEEEPVAPVDPFAGVSAGRLAEAKRYADAGMFGRAKQQIELGGGTWDESADLSQTLRSEASTTDNYGGDFKDQEGINAVVSKITSDGKVGKAKKAYVAAGGTWSKAVHKRLKATYNRQNNS